MLERLRFSPQSTRGRRYREAAHPYRGEFERDRDRIVHSRAFRRLQEKTQVFTAALSDHVRNRLTHTIEVAQISRTATRALGLNEDLAEALALGHDLGHPPFGHAGEQVLDAEMRRHGDSFEHNVHSLRIVESFERRYASFRGLNLMFETREGLLKHSRDFSPAERPDLTEYLLDRRPLLEAQLIDSADEIAYNCADLDDAVEAGLLSLDQAREELPQLGALLDQADQRFPQAHRWERFNEALGGLIDFLVGGLIEGTRGAAEDSGVKASEEVCALPERLARLSPDPAATSRGLKSLLAREVYRSAELERESARSSEKVQELFRFFLDSPDSMPSPYRDQAEREPLHRAVCDYIAGMTDSYLVRRHAELLG